jgi:hypothetical protein
MRDDERCIGGVWCSGSDAITKTGFNGLAGSVKSYAGKIETFTRLISFFL